MTPPPWRKPAVRCVLRALRDLRVLLLFTAVSCGDAISRAKPSLVGGGYGLVAVAVPAADRGESPVEDGDMAQVQAYGDAAWLMDAVGGSPPLGTVLRRLARRDGRRRGES